MPNTRGRSGATLRAAKYVTAPINSSATKEIGRKGRKIIQAAVGKARLEPNSLSVPVAELLHFFAEGCEAWIGLITCQEHAHNGKIAREHPYDPIRNEFLIPLTPATLSFATATLAEAARYRESYATRAWSPSFRDRVLRPALPLIRVSPSA
jgi:hypothetical protein